MCICVRMCIVLTALIEKHDDYHRHHNNRRPRLSSSQQTLLRLRREVVEIGEPSRFKLSEMIHHLGQGLSNMDSDEVRSGVLQTVCVTIAEQPHKIPLLAGAIQIANLKNEFIGQVAIELAHSKIQDHLNSGNWLKLKNFVRFICSLSPIIEGNGVFKLLSGLMEKAINLQQSAEEVKRSPIAEELYVLVLLSLPYYVKAGEDDKQVNATLSANAEEILRLSGDFQYKRDDNQVAIIKPFVSTTLADGTAVSPPYEVQEYISVVKSALESVAEDKWQLSHLIDISSMVKLLAGYDKFLETKKSHVFPALNIPEDFSTFESSYLFVYPHLFFQAYMPTIFETVPSPASIEGVLLRDLANDLIYGLDFNRKEVTRQLITLDLFFAPDTFAEPGISFDRLETIEQGKSTWKVEDVALEAILEDVFSLPSTPNKPVYYHSILIAACIMAPQSIAPVFGRAIRFLYSNLQTLDVELFYRLLDWFSHHISNFGFKWKWEEWTEDLKLDEWHPKQKFIRELVLKEIRLSYPKRVEETLPNEFLPLVPDIPEDPPFEYLDDPNNPYGEIVQRLISVFKETRENVEMENNNQSSESSQNDVINELKDKITSESVGGRADEMEKLQVETIVTTVCYMGNRSLSHAENWVGRTAEAVKKVVGDEVSRQQDAVKAVLKYWKHQPYVGLAVLVYFYTNGIVSEGPVISTILEQPDLLISDCGWNSLIDWISRSEQSSEQIKSVLEKLETDYQQLSESAEQHWKAWWYKGMYRALARKFHRDLSAVQVNVENAELSEVLVQARSLNA